MYLEKLKKFLDKKSSKKKLIVVYWPTACWKTWLSLDISKKLKTEIISTDSRQVYKGIDIWTAKIKKEDMLGIKHHMIDIIEISQNYSVWEFKSEVSKIIDFLHKKEKIPVLVWWTGLYIDSIIYDFDIPRIPADLDLRNDLIAKSKNFWDRCLYDYLLEIDPVYAKTIHPNNLNYIIRALEVKILSWKSKVEFISKKTFRYNTFFITPYDWDRKKLYERIDERVDIMLEEGLLNELKNLLKKYKKTDFGFKTIWYEELIRYIDWELSLEEAKTLIKKNSRNYAKRQLTWFRKYWK